MIDKIKNQLVDIKKSAVAGVAVVASAVSTSGFCAMDYSTITGAVDFADVMTGIGALAVVIMGIHVAIKGAGILITMLKRG